MLSGQPVGIIPTNLPKPGGAWAAPQHGLQLFASSFCLRLTTCCATIQLLRELPARPQAASTALQAQTPAAWPPEGPRCLSLNVRAPSRAAWPSPQLLPPPPPLRTCFGTRLQPSLHPCVLPADPLSMPPRSISSVVRQLQSGKGARQLQQAAEAAAQLCGGGESDLRQFVDGGGVEALASVLRSRGSGTAAKQAAVGALRVLAETACKQPALNQGGYPARISNAVAAAGIARPLMQVLQQAAASSSLLSVALVNDVMIVLLSTAQLGPTDRAAVADAGAIPLLLDMLLSRLPMWTRGIAAFLLAHMARDDPSMCHAVAASGGVQRIAAALQGTFDTASDDGSSMLASLQERLAATLCSFSRLAKGSDAAVPATAVPALLQCLAEGGRQAQVAAGGALVNIALHWPHLLPAVVAAGGIDVVMALLQHSTDATLLTLAVRLLYMIGRELPERHPELQAAGAVPALQRLEETCQDGDVRDAARLALQCLETCRWVGWVPSWFCNREWKLSRRWARGRLVAMVLHVLTASRRS